MAGLSQSEPLFEAFDLISSTTVLGALYGVTFTLYCLCAQSWYLQLRDSDKRGQARFTLGYISLVLFCVTAILVSNAGIDISAYINHPDYPGGPLAYEVSYNSTTRAYRMAGGTFNLIVEVLTMAIQIWRLWITWSGTRYAVVVTILPLSLLLSYIALGAPIIIAAAILPLDQLGISLQSAIAMDTASYAVLSVFTILVTGLIAAHLLFVRWRNIRLMGASDSSSPYVGIVAMLIESYALESVWSIASAISRGLNSPSYFLFQENDPIVKAIAYFLVVYRVANGRAWTRDTERKLTSLQFNHGAPTATDEASGIHSRVTVPMVVVAMGSRPISHSESAV